MGISQQTLAEALGLTFQQVQKYERGFNRVSASKLYETARFLRAPIAYFFEGLTGATAEITHDTDGEAVRSFLQSPEGLELANAFPRIKAKRLRRSVLDLVRALDTEAA